MDPDRFRNLLAFSLITAFVAVLPLMVFQTIPTDNKEIVVYMVGQLSGMATMALGFYFTNKAGADALDAKRAETTGKMADAISAAAAASPAPAEQLGQVADRVADAAAEEAERVRAGASHAEDTTS